MKTTRHIIGISSLVALLCVGCKESAPSPSDSAAAPSGESSEPVSIEEKVTETAETAKQVISDTSAKAQELLSQAQKLVGEKKYEEAGNLLQKLADFELTPEQQKVYDNLKAAIQKALESEAVQQGTKAIGNMLGGEK